MNISKILRALAKAACTLPSDAESAAYDFMDAIISQKENEGTAFEAGFYASVPGDDAEERLVRGWLAEARTLKRQCDELIEIANDSWPMGLGNLDAYSIKCRRQYLAELRNLAERIHKAMEEHEA